MRAKPKTPLPPPRVRREPPTIEEAVLAAQGLSTDPEIMVELAAGLMGVSTDEIRPHLPKSSPRSVSILAGARSVVVERRPIRRVAMARPAARMP